MTHDFHSSRPSIEAAVLRRLIDHLRNRADVQNIDMMDLAGFCRNCLSNWMEEEAKAQGVVLTRAEARQLVYGMPYEEWKAKHQSDTSDAQRKAFDEGSKHSH